MAALVITPEIEAAAQKLAAANGTTPTEAVAEVLRARLRELSPETANEREARMDRVNELVQKLHALPVDWSVSDDEILGYDEFGIPEQAYLRDLVGRRA